MKRPQGKSNYYTSLERSRSRSRARRNRFAPKKLLARIDELFLSLLKRKKSA